MEKFFSQLSLQKILLLLVLLTFSGCSIIRGGFTFKYSSPDVETPDTGGGDTDDGSGDGNTGDDDDEPETPEPEDLEAWVALVGGKKGTYYFSQNESYPVSFSENAEEFDMGNSTYTLTDDPVTATSATYTNQTGTHTYTMKISVTSESGGTIVVYTGTSSIGQTYNFTFD